MPKKTKKDSKYLDVNDVARLCSVSKATVYYWVQNKKIPFMKLPTGALRFDSDDLEDWLGNGGQFTVKEVVEPTKDLPVYADIHNDTARILYNIWHRLCKIEKLMKEEREEKK